MRWFVKLLRFTKEPRPDRVSDFVKITELVSDKLPYFYLALH